MSLNSGSIQSQFHLNENKPSAANTYEFENFRLDAVHMMLYRDGEPVSLAPKVVETLLALIEKRGDLIGKEELMKRLWGNLAVEEANLTQNIYLLRKTLGKNSDGRDLIETFRRRGYRFNGELKTTESAELLIAKHTETRIVTEEIIEVENNDELAAPAQLKSAPASNLKFRLASAAIIVLALTAAVLIYFLNRSPNAAMQSGVFSQNISLTRLTPHLHAAFPTVSPDGKLVAYALVEKDGQSLCLKEIASGKTSQLLPKINKGYRSLRFSPDGNSIYYLTHENDLARVSVSGGEPQELIQNIDNAFAISPDGGQAAFIRSRNLMIADIEGSNERILAARGGESKWFSSSERFSWSPDGKRIAISGGYFELGQRRPELLEISVADGAETRLPTMNWAEISSVVWLQNASGLLLTARETLTTPAQIWHLSYPSSGVTRLTNDLHSYQWLDVSADSRLIVSSQMVGGFNIWVGLGADFSDFKQVTFNDSEIVGRAGLAFMPDKRIVYALPSSGNIDLWIMDQDGSNSRQLTTNAGEWNGRQKITPDGRFIVLVSTRAGARNIWRIDAETGGSALQLTTGVEQDYLDLSPGGQWIYYTDLSGETPAIRKISINGGESVKISGSEPATAPAVSPDGSLLAYLYSEESAPNTWKVGVMKTDSGEQIKKFDFSPHRRILSWSPDSRALIYIADKSPNLWQQPLDGSQPHQLTNFTLEETWNFAFSPDYQKIAVARGNATTEAVLITNSLPAATVQPTVNKLPAVSQPDSASPKLYAQMSDDERRAFVKEQTRRVQILIGNKPQDLSAQSLQAIKSEIEHYAERTDNLSQKPFEEGLRIIYGRATQLAPVVARAYGFRRVAAPLGIYQAMIESEYHDCLVSPTGNFGLFQFTEITAKKYGIESVKRCDVEKQSAAAAHYMSDLLSDFGDEKTLALFAFNLGESDALEYLRQLRERGEDERSFRAIIKHADELQPPLPEEAFSYVPRFYAAAIIGENPQAFALATPPLSSLGTKSSAR